MSAATVYNTTPGPLVIDDAGHTVAGHERREDVETDGRTVDGRVVRPLLDAGLLIIVDEEEQAAAAEPAEEPAEDQAPADQPDDEE